MGLTTGTRLGPYEITGPLGAGGMGEVYRARDTRLKREVALKILPETFAADPERVARFQREAEVLATLNHPHIAGIYGIEETPAGLGAGLSRPIALILELVEGETLADRIARGAIPLDDALPIARQIAEALEAAHEHGIIHRDLKPANIKLRPDGTVKVLDFGLAKLAEPSSGVRAIDVTASPTITSPAMMTGAGMILGTAAYMAPEQAKGRLADRRSDVWAFGCVLYEMLTGRRAFDGEDMVDVLGAVARLEPNWEALSSDVPPAIRTLLHSCLVKDRRHRVADISTALFVLDQAASLAAPVGTAPAAGGERRRQRVLALAIAFLLGGVVAGSVVWAVLRPFASQSSAAVSRLLVDLRPADALGGEEGRPIRTAMALSPDGRSLVFTALLKGQRQLFLRRLADPQATPLPGTEGAMVPFFSPDGRSVGFWAGNELRKVPLDGGPPQTICKVAGSVVFGASWGADDRIVFAPQIGGLFQVSAVGGTPEPLTVLDASQGEVSHRLPHVLPDGDRVLFTVTRNRFPRWDETRIALFSRRDGTRKIVVEGGADARYVPSGHLVYARQGVLMGVPFDLTSGSLTGKPVALTADLMQTAYHASSNADSGAAQFSVSASGLLVYTPGGVFPEAQRAVMIVDRAGRQRRLPIPPRFFVQARLSPDGQRVALYTAGLNQDIWISEIARGSLTRLTTAGRNAVPVWTPDGARIVYRSSTGGPDNLFWVPADGSAGAERLATSERNQVPGAWSPDGGTLAFYEFADDGASGGDIWTLSTKGNAPPRPILETPFDEGGVDFSPDGRWIAYSSNESGQNEVYVRPYPGPGPRVQISVSGGASPVWARNGQELFYMTAAGAGGIANPTTAIMAVRLNLEPTLRMGKTTQLFQGRYLRAAPARAYDVTADGQGFLLVEDPERSLPPITSMIVVENWLEELKRLVPTN